MNNPPGATLSYVLCSRVQQVLSSWLRNLLITSPELSPLGNTAPNSAFYPFSLHFLWAPAVYEHKLDWLKSSLCEISILLPTQITYLIETVGEHYLKPVKRIHSKIPLLLCFVVHCSSLRQSRIILYKTKTPWSLYTAKHILNFALFSNVFI